MRGPPRGLLGTGEHDHLFQENKGLSYFIFTKGNFDKFINNLLTGSKEERVNFSRDQGAPLPPRGGPLMWLLTALVSII